MKQSAKFKNISALILMFILHGIAVFTAFILSEGSLGNTYFDVPEILCFAPFLIPAIADLILVKKLGTNPFLTFISPLVLVFTFFIIYITTPEALFKSLSENLMYSSSSYTCFLLSLLTLAIKGIMTLVECISAKYKKLIAASLVCLVVSISFFFCGINYESELNQLLVSMSTGERDKTGSWGSINQEVSRNENWQEYVTDTPFKLGEIFTKTEDGYTDYYCDKGTYPNIDGSTVCVPMAVEFARQHLNFEDKTANDFVQFSTTHYAYENLMGPDNQMETYVHHNLGAFIDIGSTDLVIATEPSDEELAQAEDLGITLVKQPVCYDAFVFITHKDNPVDSLTVEQIKAIYSGEITNWKDVGGKNEKIRAFQREKNSGSQTAMENLVMGTDNMIDPITVKVIEGMGGLVDAVAEYENETASIGYTYRYYIDTLYKNDNIKTLAINGIAPTDDNIRSGAYPYTTNYYGVIRQGDEDKVGGQFLNWILSDEGQKCVAQAGYIALK